MGTNSQNLPLPPNLDELLPGCKESTWRDKMEFCRLEGRTYAEDGVLISENPYIRDSWPWHWFNEAYMEHMADCAVA